MYRTDMYEGMLAETIALQGAQGDMINAYFARPLGPGPFPGVVLIHHMPGWDAWYREATRKFAAYGYLALSPNLYCREGHGAPEDVAARVRGAGGVPDDQVVGDAAGASSTGCGSSMWGTVALPGDESWGRIGRTELQCGGVAAGSAR